MLNLRALLESSLLTAALQLPCWSPPRGGPVAGSLHSSALKGTAPVSGGVKHHELRLPWSRVSWLHSPPYSV